MAFFDEDVSHVIHYVALPVEAFGFLLVAVEIWWEHAARWLEKQIAAFAFAPIAEHWRLLTRRKPNSDTPAGFVAWGYAYAVMFGLVGGGILGYRWADAWWGIIPWAPVGAVFSLPIYFGLIHCLAVTIRGIHRLGNGRAIGGVGLIVSLVALLASTYQVVRLVSTRHGPQGEQPPAVDPIALVACAAIGALFLGLLNLFLIRLTKRSELEHSLIQQRDAINVAFVTQKVMSPFVQQLNVPAGERDEFARKVCLLFLLLHQLNNAYQQSKLLRSIRVDPEQQWVRNVFRPWIESDRHLIETMRAMYATTDIMPADFVQWLKDELALP